jgi:RNA polymerase sigma factor (sigma-70 family)
MKVSRKTAKLFVSGDEEARTQVYLAYRRILFFLIVSIVNEKEDAEDLLSETFLKVMGNASSIRDPSAIDSYLTKTATNLSYDFLAKRQDHMSYDSIEDTIGEKSHDNYYLQELNSLLSDRENVVVTLVILYGYSLREVATILNISKSEAHLIYKGAIKTLRRAYSAKRR